jgi:CBS domain-containing protein
MYEFLHYQVKDFMTSSPVAVDLDVSLSTVASIFEEHEFNGLPVVSSDDKLIGMVTKLDLLKAFTFTTVDKIPPYESTMGEKVSLVMTREPYTFSPETPLTRVLQKMIDTGFKSFPVIDHDKVIGIISREDVVNALQRAAQTSWSFRFDHSESVS